jgi:hypothetical protein
VTAARGVKEPAAPPLGRPLRVLGRIALVTLVMVTISYRYSERIVECLLPIIRAEILALDRNLEILSLTISTEGPSRMVRMHANLNHPVYLADRSIYPVGWWPYSSTGFYQIQITVASLLQAPVLLCIVVLAWPHRSLRELILRLFAAIAAAALLFAIDAPIELVGNFHSIAFFTDAPHAPDIYFEWDRFLEGGGRPMLALASAAQAIVAGTALARRPAALRPVNTQGSAAGNSIGAPQLIIDDRR